MIRSLEQDAVQGLAKYARNKWPGHRNDIQDTDYGVIISPVESQHDSAIVPSAGSVKRETLRVSHSTPGQLS